MTQVLQVSENRKSSAGLFKSLTIRFDNNPKNLFNDHWLSPLRPKTKTHDDGYHCTMYITTTKDNH